MRRVPNRSRSRLILVATLASVVSIGSGCGDDGDGKGGTDTVTFRMRIENVSPAYELTGSGVFNTPVGADSPAPIGPGGAYEVAFGAAPGTRLSFATMFVPSNDFFFAPDEEGIELFDEDGVPLSGDVTSQMMLWDAGTEFDQEPGVGPDQVQRQSAPNTGAADPNDQVRLAEDAFGTLPADAEVIRVTIAPMADNQFVLRIENVSGPETLMTSTGPQAVPLSPGVFVLHTGVAPLFSVGQPDRGEGLEAIAEDGQPGQLADALAGRTGLTVPLSPGVLIIHTAPDPLFTVGEPDRDEGLEAIAEDGDPAELANSLFGSRAFNTPVGAGGPAPIGPGGAYEITFDASRGDRLSFATMLVPSNDFFFAPDEDGIELFDSNGGAISGDVTAQVMLWDAGTEVNQEPGSGPDQVQRQSGPNTGVTDTDNRVRLAEDTFGNLPPDADVIRVTITSE